MVYMCKWRGHFASCYCLTATATLHSLASQSTNSLAAPLTNTNLRTLFEHTQKTSFFCPTTMDVLDGVTRLDPDMNEEAQRWTETAKGRRKTRPPSSDESPSLHTNTERSVSASSAIFRSPPSSRMATESTQQEPDRNTFEESFTAALAHPLVTYDGHFDHNDDYDDQTPLLNSYYKASYSPQQTAAQTPRHAPIEAPSKSKPSRSICLWNEVAHNSQYTRPAADILREVLEVRYPVTSTPAGYEQLQGERELQGSLIENEARMKRRWWRKLLRVRVHS
jgi:hypothetical protein